MFARKAPPPVKDKSPDMGGTSSRRDSNRGSCSTTGGVGRLSLRRLLLHSPLLGHRLRSAAHRVVEGRQSSRRTSSTAATTPPRANIVRPSPSTQQPSQDQIFEDDILECPLCLGDFEIEFFPPLSTCTHRSCKQCLRRYLSIEIQESRVCIACPQCSESMHPNDIKQILDNKFIYEKYEDFMVRRVLAADPDTRWCPAPDCNFAVVAQGCASCPELWCQAPGCGRAFCYHCKAAWHPNQTCDAARRQRAPPPVPAPPPQAHHSPSESDHAGLVKPCPRCSVLIGKIEDGSCNHMICCVCGSEFCWLCMKEISDLHYLSPSGCTFWGKAPWSRKKKLLWQLGTLAGAPLGIALLAGVAAPALLLGLPVWAGRRARARCRKLPPAKRRALVAAAVAAAILAAPAVAGLAVGIGVPILLFYVYGVVPVSLCRSGGCGLSTSPSGGVRIDFDEDNAPRASDACGLDGSSIAGAGGSSSGLADSRKSGGNGSPSSGGARSTPAHTGSIASQDRLHSAHRLEVTADVVSALRLSLSSEAASLSEPIPPDDASTRALAGSIRDYKQNHSETVSYSAADDCGSERVRFDDNVSIIGPSSNADYLPDTLTDKHSICSSRSFRSLGKSSINEELSESLDKSSIGSGPRNVIFEENIDDEDDIQESPKNSTRRTIPKLTLKSNHKHFASFEEDVTSKTPPDVVKFLERTDKAMNLINKQNKASTSSVSPIPTKFVVSTSYTSMSGSQSFNPVERPGTPIDEFSRGLFDGVDENDLEAGSEVPKRPLSKVAMLRNIFFHGSSYVNEEDKPIEAAVMVNNLSPTKNVEDTVVTIENPPDLQC